MRNEEKGIDYDLSACIDYNIKDFTTDDIEEVLAVWEGENDGDSWRWIIRLNESCNAVRSHYNMQYIFLQGSCDYTGWDCQSWATFDFGETAEDCLKYAKGDIEVDSQKVVQNSGLGQLISMLGGSYGSNFDDVYESLASQLQAGKNQTWTEKKDDEFNTKDIPKVG